MTVNIFSNSFRNQLKGRISYWNSSKNSNKVISQSLTMLFEWHLFTHNKYAYNDYPNLANNQVSLVSHFFN